jgi:isoleucyl-tRNA synthetase
MVCNSAAYSQITTISPPAAASGLIYSAHRPVSYSPSSHSALAEAELEYFDNHVSTSVYLAFQLDAAQIPPGTPLGAFVRPGRRVEVLVWTTTPWTLSANMVGRPRMSQADEW